MAQWTVDPAHSEITFKVKHLVISTVTGQFRSFKGEVRSEAPDFSDARATFEARVESISTNNDQRDGHLKSPDFFDAERFPTITFVSTSIVRQSADSYVLIGDMMIHGITRRISLDVTYNGTAKGFEGDIAAFEITGKLSRQEFGLRWNTLTESGGIVVGDEIRLSVVAELKKATVEIPVAV